MNRRTFTRLFGALSPVLALGFSTKALGQQLYRMQSRPSDRYTPPKTARELWQRLVDLIIGQLGVKESEVTPDVRFIEDLGADSLDTVELVMAAEEEFEIEIPDEDAEKLTTPRAMHEYLERKVLK